MFLALRELGFARGRFTLMGAVISLIAALVVLLSGLSSGLVNDGVSGLKSLSATAFAFDKGTIKDNAFSRSLVDGKQLQAWRDAPGIEHAEPMGVSIVKGTTSSGHQVDLTLFGVQPSGFLAPAAAEGKGLGAPEGIVVSSTLKAKGMAVGDTVTLDRIGTVLTVAGFTDGQATFGHVDVAYLPIGTWRLLASATAKPGAPTQAQVDAADYPYSSVVALKAAPGRSPDYSALDAGAGTMTMTKAQAFNASPGYEAETLTLSMIQVFLYAICALVVGAFFTVWTIQRTQEIAVLRAIGASGGYLLRDGLAQGALLLLAFTALGVAVGVGFGAMIPDAVPFALEAAPIGIATALTVVLGLLGAAVAVLRITRVDPITALGGNR
ncbi:ABC transporter permease [Sinomonas atrocyanea]|uniref:ABC transporter permease n=1 Tax=Sinomonas atrocyanea TaxID=37927 RepID=UPI00285432A7|nr:ABC transporter permease [Sinomonas atrocyanea]MDR6620379.1 putative ABC transport system permease protein [Sinomonas atrocyanea]